MNSAFVLAGGIHHHKHFQNRGVTGISAGSPHGDPVTYSVTCCSLNKGDPTAFLWVLCLEDVWPHAETCPGELPISKLHMMENIACRIHFYDGSMTVSSMHSGITKLEYIPISFNFLSLFHGFGSHTPYLSWLEVPTIGTVFGELEETTQALLRAQPQTAGVRVSSGVDADVILISVLLKFGNFRNNSLGNPAETEDA